MGISKLYKINKSPSLSLKMHFVSSLFKLRRSILENNMHLNGGSNNAFAFRILKFND